MRLWLTPLLVASCAKSPSTASLSVENAVVDTVNGRRLDLEPLLLGSPDTPVLPLWDAGVLLFDHRTEGRALYGVAADYTGAPPSFDNGKPLSSVDWNQRSRWDMRLHGPSNSLYWLGDENNTERINVWHMPVQGGEPSVLTDHDYTYGMSFSPDKSQLATLPRTGEGPYTTCLNLMSLDSGTTTQVLCDTPQATLTWHDPSWSPDARGILTRVNVDGSRSKGNLAWIDLATGKMTLLLDPAPKRRAAYASATWLDANTAVAHIDDDAIERIIAINVQTGEQRTLWTPALELSSFSVLGAGSAARLVVIEGSPAGDTVRVIDPATSKPVFEQQLPGNARWLGDDESHRAMLRLSSPTTPMQTYLLDITADEPLRPWLGIDPATTDRLVRCDVRPVSIPTWDTDPNTGKTRMLHAFLYTPKKMSEPAKVPARITAFYGGDNRFNIDHQIHCAAGVTTLSPAVRGGYGFGPAFTALNDGDLGGDEIVDLFESARWLETQGFEEGNIGVYGGSHGGYATMRALTFPPGTNDHGTERLYPFAFGVSRAGFSDIVTFWETCNIPDWVLLEAGDPNTQADALRDRSPLHHVQRLQAPLLMVHGENDSRVPVAESRQMKAACDAAQKECIYLEYPGMGHHIQGLANQARWYGASFKMMREATAD
ncbi:MAG: prolyl oligopeptidase family serine peptidase [Myxococcota bacterium]